MGKQSAWVAIQKKRWPLLILALFSLFTAMVFFTRTAFDSCATTSETSSVIINNNHFGEDKATSTEIHSVAQKVTPNPLDFMKSKLVLLVSHELSLSGNSIFYFLFF